MLIVSHSVPQGKYCVTATGSRLKVVQSTENKQHNKSATGAQREPYTVRECKHFIHTTVVKEKQQELS